MKHLARVSMFCLVLATPALAAAQMPTTAVVVEVVLPRSDDGLVASNLSSRAQRSHVAVASFNHPGSRRCSSS